MAVVYEPEWLEGGVPERNKREGNRGKTAEGGCAENEGCPRNQQEIWWCLRERKEVGR
ncbi:MAG: hypothetical protein Kow0099_38450 [Candidatus Abyssubacteria bacterium]